MAQGDAEESVEPALDSQLQPCHGTEKENDALLYG